MAAWPTTPLPPVRLTTVTGWPSSFSSSEPMMRAVASVPPPAPHGTISVTGRSGHAACAPAAANPLPIASAASANFLTNSLRRFMAPPCERPTVPTAAERCHRSDPRRSLGRLLPPSRVVAQLVRGLVEQVLELVRLDRLQQMVAVADAEAALAIGRLAEAAHRDRVAWPAVAELGHQRPAVAVRQADVGDQDVALRARQLGKGVAHRRRREHGVAELLEQEAEQEPRVLVVLDDEDPQRPHASRQRGGGLACARFAQWIHDNAAPISREAIRS